MKLYKHSKILLVVFLISIMACNLNNQDTHTNILLKDWSGPYGGVPAFDKLDVNEIKSTMIKAMDLNLDDIDEITSIDVEPTFENTIIALEKSGQELSRAYAYYGILSSNMSTPEFRAIQAELSPKFSDFRSKINQNKKLFNRIKSIYDNSQDEPLDSQEQRVVELIYTSFIINGAELNEEKKLVYANINKELSSLYTKFSNNVLNDEENYITYLDKNQLDGLPDDYIKSAARIASDKGNEGKFAVTNTRSSMDPFLKYSTERELRKKVWTNYYSRGNNDDEFDNKKLIEKILKLRRQRVELLGFENYAEWRLQDRMAKKPENVMNLLLEVWPAAVKRVKEEVNDMQLLADELNHDITIKPWDYRFYAEKVRKKQYDLDSDEVKQYLQLDNLIDAMHFVAGELFNFKFSPIEKGVIPVYQEDVKVWEVNDLTSGDNIGLWYLDPYAREGKRSGAWANTFRSYSTFDGKKNVLGTNNSNFVKPAPGEVSLISWDDAETLFHEFGHALHYFSSDVKYPTLNGGVRDYTEFQSQLLERWLSTDKVINNYLVHYKTGKPIPLDLVKKIKNASTFNQGFTTTEYMASALIDMLIHLEDPSEINVEEFEKNTLSDLGMPKELPMRHRTTHFGHVFSGEGYATAYYGYMWADVLTSDASEAFEEAENGYYDKVMADKLVKYLFSPRNAIEPAEAYRLFRGRDAEIDALLRDRGFPLN